METSFMHIVMALIICILAYSVRADKNNMISIIGLAIARVLSLAAVSYYVATRLAFLLGVIL